MIVRATAAIAFAAGLALPLGLAPAFRPDLWLLRADPLVVLSLPQGGPPPVALALAVAVLVAAAAGVLFCDWLCPVGLLIEVAERILLLRIRAARALPWRALRHGGVVILVAGAAGASLSLSILWLFDPLAIASRAFTIGGDPSSAAPLRIASIAALAALPLASLIARRFWCRAICPLGALVRLSARLGARIRRPIPGAAQPATAAPAAMIAMTRRGVIATMAAAAAAGSERPARLRPPGARDDASLFVRCTRCGACIDACPTGILRPSLTGPLPGLLTPVFVPDWGGCPPECTACGSVCPTGAIRSLTPKEKARWKVGIAVIDRARCFPWAQGMICFSCFDLCPYRAIRMEPGAVEPGDGFPRPIVIEEKCVGCGICEPPCPVAGEKAIRIRPASEL
ncbi:MAG: 4Fe-4S binding protein [Planctomycetes bacterium]|nr:4Fe-4S binding protein [Planctomycetota bacterium]